MNTQSRFARSIRGFAALSALLFLFALAAPSAMAQEGYTGKPIAGQQGDGGAEPGCD